LRLQRLILVLAAFLGGCVPMPVRLASGVTGVVVDAASREPVAGAVVVVRFEGSYDEVLPEREVLGHREAISDATGRFRTPPLVARGMTAWPWLRVRAQVASVWAEGRRCPAEVPVPARGELVIPLAGAASEAVRRESCRPVSAPVAQIPHYVRLWRGLYADAAPEPPAPQSPSLVRSLEARSYLGFGANCRGPVEDLSLGPRGELAALLVARGDQTEVEVVSVAGGDEETRVVARTGARPGQQLRWQAAGLLTLVTPKRSPAVGTNLDADEAVLAGPVVWRAPDLGGFPAAPAPLAEGELDPPPAVNDEASTRFQGRSFELLQTLEAETGLPRDQLRVSEPTGELRLLDLPGEACRMGGRFGRPHYRLSGDGRSGLDLRFIDDGCRAVAIDLETGSWRVLGNAGEPAQCARSRRMPRSQLQLALRGYLGELDQRLEAAGLDPASAYTLRLGTGRSGPLAGQSRLSAGRDTTIEARDARGAQRVLAGPPFPVATPLERLEISVVAPPPRGHPASVDAAPEGWRPL
jgi:hypothetical protein